ncbi:MAG: carboxypeptidase-like regulatory domain-containing protein, partial [Bacteroidota bacterium]
MINKAILWVFIMIQLPALWSQTLSGYVYDDKTGLPLETVAVYFDNTTVGTTTSSEGFFTINYSDAIKYNLVISFLGYENIYL